MDPKAVVRFTEAEAKEKIGHEVRSLIEFAGVPRDTLGRVVSVHEFDSGSFDVVVNGICHIGRIPRIGLQKVLTRNS